MSEATAIPETLAPLFEIFEDLFREMQFDREEVPPAKLIPIAGDEGSDEITGLCYLYIGGTTPIQAIIMDNGLNPLEDAEEEMAELPTENWLNIFDTHPDTVARPQVEFIHQKLEDHGFQVTKVVSLDVDKMAEENPDYANLRPMPVVIYASESGQLAMINASPVPVEEQQEELSA